MTWNPFPQLAAIQRTLNDIDTKVSKIMSEQAEIDADVAELTAAVTAIQAEIATLQAANPALDLTALKAKVDAVAAIAPAAPPAS